MRFSKSAQFSEETEEMIEFIWIVLELWKENYENFSMPAMRFLFTENYRQH
jgi:hypothetical protein